MTKLNNGQIVTDIDADDHNATLNARGYTVRHIETWHAMETTCIVWDAPEITDADIPF